MTVDEMTEVLRLHCVALYSWGPEDCTCQEWEGPLDQHPRHQAEMLKAAGA